MKKTTLSVAALAAASMLSTATAQLRPEFMKPDPSGSMLVTALSDNGLWGISESGSSTEGDIRPSGGTLVDLSGSVAKHTAIKHESGLAGVADVTDDGTIVVGEAQTKPAYWSSATGAWTFPELPAGYAQGRLMSVTPDGHYAVGTVQPADDIWTDTPVMYDLTTGERIDLPGMPTIDLGGSDQKQNLVTAISADARYVLGNLSRSYPPDCLHYVYDRNDGTYKAIGFTRQDNGKYAADVDGLFFIDSSSLSPDGRWVTGMAYMAKEIGGGNRNEYYAGYRYDVEQGKIEVYDGAADADVAGFSIANDGVVLAATPAVNPYSAMMVRNGRYYYPFDDICKQAYGFDFYQQTGMEVVGKPLCVSADGKTLVMLPGTTDTYIIKLHQPLSEVCPMVNLLGTYSLEPADGSRFTTLTKVRVQFNRPIAVWGDADQVKLVDAEGKEVQEALTAKVADDNANTLVVGFKATKLADGQAYKVVIPAGTVNIDGDRDATSPEITVSYVGRADQPVAVTKIYPEDGASFAKLDFSTNPMLLDFDAQIKLADGSKAYLYREGEGQPYCELNLAVAGNQMMAYPLSTQYLFAGTDYRVEIPEGVVTDISGKGASKALTVSYHGTYVREITPDDKYLFNDDCSSYENFMFYDGDHNAPADQAAEIGFTAETTPWFIVRESLETSDMAIASNSMYRPAGKADDWMMTPQLFVPDANCYLSFDGQSYLEAKDDHIKVYVYASDNVYNTLTADLAAAVRAEGRLVLDQKLTPGQSEDLFAGDWRSCVVPLADYAGQSIYIAFVNENEDQSLVILDNIQVVRDVKALVTIDTPSRVVGQESAVVKGSLTIASGIDTFASVDMALRDADGKTVSTVKQDGLQLKKDDVYRFEFPTPLPLLAGRENKYTIDIALDQEKTTVQGSVKNMSFAPVRKVVLEEYSGSECGNCPQGIVAIENLERLYGEQFIPVAVRTYSGDPLGLGMESYSEFLGCDKVGAPSGRINRGNVLFPMIVSEDTYHFSGTGIANPTTGADEVCWLDEVQALMAQPVEADVALAATYDPETREVKLESKVRSALDCDNQNISLFAVIVENGLTTYQANYFSTVDDPIFGDWGKGGAYGTTTVYPMTANDVARATFGTTFNGTGGLVPAAMASGQEYTATMTGSLPATVENPANCKAVVMMIDANTDRVINADCVALREQSGINDIMGGNIGADVRLGLNGDTLTVGASIPTTVEVYDLAGQLLAQGAGHGTFDVKLGGFSGVAIVRAHNAAGTTVNKVAVK